MFTGIVMDLGRLERQTPTPTGARFVVRCDSDGPYARALRAGAAPAAAFTLGESIAVEGVCLTVVAIGPATFEADVSHETLARTTLGALRPGRVLNLERALAVGDRLGGHIVSGHVDDRATVVAMAPAGDGLRLTFRIPRRLSRFVAEKGSVCVSGVSLTVNAVTDDTFDVTIIPHTRAATSLATLEVGAAVNLEVDVVARSIARLVDTRHLEGATAHESRETDDAAWLARLTRGGYV